MRSINLWHGQCAVQPWKQKLKINTFTNIQTQMGTPIKMQICITMCQTHRLCKRYYTICIDWVHNHRHLVVSCHIQNIRQSSNNAITPKMQTRIATTNQNKKKNQSGNLHFYNHLFNSIYVQWISHQVA